MFELDVLLGVSDMTDDISGQTKRFPVGQKD